MKIILRISLTFAITIFTINIQAGRFSDLEGYLPIGVNAGRTESAIEDGKHYQLGVEASYAYIYNSLFWGGVYTDVSGTFGTGELTYSMGPEFGYFFAGIDIGYLGIWHRDSGNMGGITGRLLLTSGILSFYFRYNRVLFHGDESYGGIGVLLKFPAWMGN